MQSIKLLKGISVATLRLLDGFSLAKSGIDSLPIGLPRRLSVLFLVLCCLQWNGIYPLKL